MASSEQKLSTRQRCFRCLICNQKVEVQDGDIALAVALHIEKHEESTTKRESDRTYHDTTISNNPPYPDNSSKICEKNEEYKSSSISSVKVYTTKHNQEEPDSEKYDSDRASRHSQNSEINEEIQGMIISEEELLNSNEGNGLFKEIKEMESFMINGNRQNPTFLSTQESSILYSMQCLKTHLGFIEKNPDDKKICKVCKVKIENTCVTEHIESKSHEHNVITYLKKLISNERLFEFDSVAFFGSNLCCIVCKCRIHLCSINPFETIVNILNHNSLKSHVQNKFGIVNSYRSSYVSPFTDFVDENKHCVEIQTQIICKLIMNDTDLNYLFSNFTAYFRNEVHRKCLKSSSVLKTSEKLNNSGKVNHNLTLKGGNIHCFTCNCYVKPNIENIREHVHVTSKQYEEKPNNEVPFYKKFGEALALYGTRAQSPVVVKKEEVNVQSLLETMPVEFQNVDYIVSKEPGKLSCLLCNYAMPLTHDDLKTHLLVEHKINEEDEKWSEPNILETPAALSIIGSRVRIDESLTLLRNNAIIDGHETLHEVSEVEKHCVPCLSDDVLQSSKDLKIDSSPKLCAQHIHPEMQKNISLLQSDQSFTINPDEEMKKSVTSSWKDNEDDPSDFHDQPNNYSNQASHVLANLRETLLPPIKTENYFTKSNQEQSHLDSVQKFYSGLVCSADVFQTILPKLKKTNEIIKTNYKYILVAKNAEEGYYCTLCLTAIHNSYDFNVLLDNVFNHFTGKRHKDFLDLVQTGELIFKVKNKSILCPCTMCFTSVPTSFAKACIKVHPVDRIAGRKHKTKRNQESMKHFKEPVSTNHPNNSQIPNVNPLITIHPYHNPINKGSIPSINPSNTSVKLLTLKLGDNLRCCTSTPDLISSTPPLPEKYFKICHPTLLDQTKAQANSSESEGLNSDSLKNLPVSQPERRFIKRGWDFVKYHLFAGIDQEKKCRLKKK